MKRLSIVLVLLAAPLLLALDAPLSELKDAEVACSASTPTPIEAAGTRAESMFISNGSATCVRIGGSGVTATTGASIGDGCQDGSNISVDVKKAWCLSTSGTITVDTLYGNR
jgi:hypothetical protein